MKKAKPNQTKPAGDCDDDTDDDDTRGSGSGSPYTRMTSRRSSTTTSKRKPHMYMEAWAWASWARIPWSRENEGTLGEGEGREQTPNWNSHFPSPNYNPEFKSPLSPHPSLSTLPSLLPSLLLLPVPPPPPPRLPVLLLLLLPDHGSSPLKSLTVDPLTGIWQVRVCAADAITIE